MQDVDWQSNPDCRAMIMAAIMVATKAMTAVTEAVMVAATGAIEAVTVGTEDTMMAATTVATETASLTVQAFCCSDVMVI